MKDITQIKEFINSRYQLRYNEVSTQTEYRLLNEQNFKPLNDRKLKSIFVEINEAQIKVAKDNLYSLLTSDYAISFNPFEHYFKNLSSVNGTENIDKLINTVDTHNNEFFKTVFIKWLVAWVACMIEDDVTNHQCVILAGKQGIGKSTWVEKLMPKELKPYYYAGDIKLGSKDTLGFIASKCLINLDELASMTYSNVTELKELVTKSHIDYRKAYGYLPESFIRRASFIGSVNGSEFLYDLTGNRRFLSIEVNSFENFGRHNIDMNLVLAEAYSLYKSGFQYWFDAKDQEEVEKNNEKFLVKSMEEIRLLKNYSNKPVITNKIENLQFGYDLKINFFKNEKELKNSSYEKIERMKKIKIELEKEIN